MKKQIVLITLSWLLSTPAFPQIYLIAGNADQSFTNSTVLVEIATGGSASAAREIVYGETGNYQSGARWIAASPDLRKAVVFTKSPDDRVMVIDFDTASIVKSCQHPEGESIFHQWLVDSPSRGLLFAADGSDKVTDEDRLFGMTLDASVPCGSSFFNLDASEMKYVLAEGYAGIADDERGNFLGVGLTPDGGLVRPWLSGNQTYLDYRAPLALFSDMKNRDVRIEINNPQILGLSLDQAAMEDGHQAVPYKLEDFRFLVFRKRDQTWSRLPGVSPGEGRGFGSFIAWSESREKTAAMPESAGKAEWRRDDAVTGPSTAGLMKLWPRAYPGVLHLYDAATEKSYSINTRQGDSEILLVENSTVYYRVSNRLYSAPILDTGIGPAKLLATDELIRDAHWAFIKH